MKSHTRTKAVVMALWTILTLGGLGTVAVAETVGLFYNSATPQHAFAAGDIGASLEARDFTVEVWELSALTDSYVGRKVVIALASDEQVTALLESQGSTGAKDLGEQAYVLRTTTTPGMSYWVLGGDDNGAMYGALQVAENINFNGATGVYNEEDTPYLKNRGVKFNIPLDRDAPTYYYSYEGTSHKEALRHVWDVKFWTTWFDEMARHRYNVLSLWSPHPFTSMLKMSDYPDVAIQGVKGFAEDDKAVQINNMTIDQKIEFWQQVMKHGRDRGFDIYFCTWNIFLSTADNKYGLTKSPHNELTKTYLRKCTREFLETYPDLAGIGITVGERMGGLDAREKEEWAWDTYGRGMTEYAKAHPNRNLVFIHRQHDGNLDHILKYFAPLNELPNVRMDLSFKYSQAHAHAAVKPEYWDRKRMADGLARHNLKSWLTVRNDDFYFLHWADAQFVRDYVRNFPEVGRYVDSFYIGSDGWVFARVFTSKDSYYESRDALCIQRTWFMQKLWGRIAYNPSVSDALFMNHLALKYPEAASEALFEAWSKASRAIQLANEQVTGSWDLDMDWWPEGWTGDCWDGRGRFLALTETKDTDPMDGSNLCSFFDTARSQCGENESAFLTADRIERLASSALRILRAMDYGANIELKLTLRDLEAMSNLSLYSANKYRAAIYIEQEKRDDALKAIASAYCYWKKYTQIMDDLYKGADMQRNLDFADWHAHDENALQDYLDLGGEGEPNCPEQE